MRYRGFTALPLFVRVIIALGVVVLFATDRANSARAQNNEGGPQPTGTPSAGTNSTPSGGSTSEGGDLAVQRRANLSGEDQVVEAEGISQRGTQVSRRVQGVLDDARRDRDVLRVTCLNDKLTQINANGRSVTDRLVSLRRAVQGRDASRANHEYTVITVLGQKFRTLEQDANQCTDSEIYETGATRVVTVIEPGTPEENVEQLNNPPLAEIPYIPGPASPVR